MRQVLLVTFGAIIAVSLVFGFFAINQVNQEQISRKSLLQSRTQVLADSLSESIEPSYNARATSTVQRIIDRFASSERLAGLGVFDNSGAPVATSGVLPISDSPELIARVMDSDEASGEFVTQGGTSFYVHVIPLHSETSVIGAFAIAQNASYINDSMREIWKDNLIRLLSQIVLFALVIFVLVRFIFYRAVRQLIESIQAIRKGDAEESEISAEGFFKPLAGEISKVTASLRQARFAASQEARMRLEKLDSPWTAERLKEFIKAYLKNRPIYVLTNREPYVHQKNKNKIEWGMPAGGVITAIEPIMETCGGLWIAHGSGSADKETANHDGKIRVPPEEPKYTLKRIWLSEKEIKGYYTGFSNEALWPLCHMAHTRPLFRAEDWNEYRKVNARFANALLQEIKDVERPIVLVQDYHLSLVPLLIKKARPDAQVALFWHIPWPSAEQFNICPWRKEILEGLLGADLLGFHTQQYCNNFIDTVGNEIESRIDFEQFAIYRGEHRTQIKPFPVSIAFPGTAEPQKPADRKILEARGIRTEYLLLGVDRLDYTKGILERFKGLEFFFERHHHYRGKVTFFQIASPTRESVTKYREYAAQVRAEAARINEKFGTADWKPIILQERHFSHEEILPLYQLADVCLVTSLHDGMNLVAKEYSAAKTDETGVLILSQFAGASRELKGAIVINPYSAKETAAAIYSALEMAKALQHRRMKIMRNSVRDYNIYRWAAEFIKALTQLE